MTERQQFRWMIIIVLAFVFVMVSWWAKGADVTRPRCKYPIEMYRPSLGICVLKKKSDIEVRKKRKRSRVRIAPNVQPETEEQQVPTKLPPTQPPPFDWSQVPIPNNFNDRFQGGPL